jgi:hypothetical protein
MDPSPGKPNSGSAVRLADVTMLVLPGSKPRVTPSRFEPKAVKAFYPAATFASRKKSSGIGFRKRQVIEMGLLPWCET